MTNTQTPNRLHKQMAEMIALESAIGRALGQAIPTVSEYSEVATMFREFQAMVRTQRDAIKDRLQRVADSQPIPDSAPMAGTGPESGDGHKYPVSGVLRTTYVAFNQALVGYSVLQTLTNRFRDNWAIGEDNTADLVKLHTHNYSRAIREISRMIHDVVLWELDGEDLECQCICPSCSIGVCLCAVSSRATLSNAWAEAGPITVDKGIYIHPPRKGSAAARAGLQSGDVVVAVDGQEVESYTILQSTVRERESGERIQLKVLRGSGEHLDLAVMRP